VKKEIPNKVHLKKVKTTINSRKKIGDSGKSYFNLLSILAIVLLGTVIYSNSFKCAFQFDDFPNIVYNPAIQNLSDVHAWWNFVPTRPLGNLTFALNYHFNKLDVRYYHYVNLTIHLVNACLVFWLILSIFSSQSVSDNQITKHKKSIALFAALLFVSHPLATQSVTYIVQRLASMAAMFYLSSIILYIKARGHKKSIINKYLLFGGCFVSGLMAIMTKENAYTLPFALILVEVFFLRKRKISVDFKDYRIYLFLAGIATLILIILLKFSLRIFDPILPEQGNTYTVTPANYLLTQFSVIIKYIQLLILPVSQNFDYDFKLSHSFFEIRTLLCFIGLLILLIIAFVLYKKHRIISFGILWFFLTLMIEASFIPIPNLIFEHRTYLPSVGFFLVLSSVLFILLGEKRRLILIALLIFIIGSNSYLTYQRNKIWKDDLSFWSDAVLKSPDKARPYDNRGFAYENRVELEKAIDDYSKAILINPDYSTAYFNRGKVYTNLQKWDNALADYSRAIRINPEDALVRLDRGFAYGSIGLWSKSIADFSIAICIDPQYGMAYNNRGFAYYNLGEYSLAIADHTAAIQLDSKSKLAYFRRGNAYFALHNWDKAIIDFTKALEIDPGFEIAASQRNIAYQNKNRMNP
jgi:protein O-mannosyl-transferase